MRSDTSSSSFIVITRSFQTGSRYHGDRVVGFEAERYQLTAARVLGKPRSCGPPSCVSKRFSPAGCIFRRDWIPERLMRTLKKRLHIQRCGACTHSLKARSVCPMYNKTHLLSAEISFSIWMYSTGLRNPVWWIKVFKSRT